MPSDESVPRVERQQDEFIQDHSKVGVCNLIRPGHADMSQSRKRRGGECSDTPQGLRKKVKEHFVPATDTRSTRLGVGTSGNGNLDVGGIPMGGAVVREGMYEAVAATPGSNE